LSGEVFGRYPGHHGSGQAADTICLARGVQAVSLFEDKKKSLTLCDNQVLDPKDKRCSGGPAWVWF